MKTIEDCRQYTVLKHEFLKDFNSDAWLLRHNKSGARVVLLPNDDDNKVFYIAFRTTPFDSTGVAHIIEHTVLCGSRDFPVKDPFIELAKGSLNTFLNAMTYPDKTVYPVASCNERDFENLMHVYLDAVFYPNIYHERRIFEQEGWHYEITDGSDGGPRTLSINGVVYNEMKGVMSSPDDVLEREITASLFPDTTYAVESGGDPEVIPELTYENYLDFHRRYYHPSNSYIYLYGNMDMAERLDYLDREYLSDFDLLEVDSKVRDQKAFEETRSVTRPYSIMKDEDSGKKSFLSYNVVLPGRDVKLDVTFRILDYVLCDAEGAPLKKALVERGIAGEVSSIYENGLNQPFWSLQAKYSDEDRKDEFEKIIREVLTDIVRNGFDKDALRAGINYHEFRYRESDFGSYPKGLIYGLAAIDSWLYDDEQPWLGLTNGDYYEGLKQEIETGWFEQAVEKWFLDNKHSSIVVLKPACGLTEDKDRELAERLSVKAASLTEEELDRIAAEEKSLREYQETPDSPEDIRRIPLLTRSDLGTKALLFNNVSEELVPGKFAQLTHPMFTNRIDYLTLAFDIRSLPERFYPYLAVLKTVFGVLNTQQHTYSELDNQINIHTGGIGAQVATYAQENEPQKYRFVFEVSIKTLEENLGEAFRIIEEILLKTNYTDTTRIREILEEELSAMRSDLASSGHVTALTRAESYFSETSAIQDTISGIGAYRMLKSILDNYEENGPKAAGILEEMAAWIFSPERLFLIDVTADEAAANAVAEPALKLRAALAENSLKTERLLKDLPSDLVKPFRQELLKGNEAFETAGQVQFVCRAGDYSQAGLSYTGAFRVLRVIMGYDYLWNRIRVKGGAYGCMSGFRKDGSAFFVTYRDPHLMNSVKTFEDAADYIRSFDADERTMTQFIIGAVSGLDQPMTPATSGRYSYAGYLMKTTDEDNQRYRTEVLSCTADTIRSLAVYIEAFMKTGAFCVVGSESKIEEHRDLFENIEKLL